jgi:hypothetical protein
LLIRNISSVYHIVAKRVIKHPGTRMEASVLCFLELGYDNDEGASLNKQRRKVRTHLNNGDAWLEETSALAR